MRALSRILSQNNNIIGFSPPIPNPLHPSHSSSLHTAHSKITEIRTILPHRHRDHAPPSRQQSATAAGLRLSAREYGLRPPTTRWDILTGSTRCMPPHTSLMKLLDIFRVVSSLHWHYLDWMLFPARPEPFPPT